jgi:hypothetical protein
MLKRYNSSDQWLLRLSINKLESTYFVSENGAEQLIGVLRVQVNKLFDNLDQVGEFVHVDRARHLRVNVIERQVVL